MDYVFLIGRIIFGGYFIFNGLNHFMKMKMMSGYAQSKGVPMANIAVPITGLMLIIGGASVLLGVYTRGGLALLVLFFLPVTFMMHNFWKVQDAQMKMGEMVNFMKNFALIGALLMMYMIQRPWPFKLML